MIRSMTGYGQSRAECDGLRVTVEARTVNHRHADVRLRLPAELSAREAALRRRVLERVRRGRVDVALNLEWTAPRSPEVVINHALVETLARTAGELWDRLALGGELDLATVLGLPGVLELREVPATWGDDEQRVLDEALDVALGALDDERRREGEVLRKDLVRRLANLERLARDMATRAAALPPEIRTRLIEKLEALAVNVELDPARVAQEATFLAERADVTEELVRLEGHLDRARAMLDEPDGDPVGKRLEFLLQEIHRETNTVNSKSSDLELSRLALELKAEAEKVREQILNLE